MNFRDRDFQNEFLFQASRSSGPGGQNVNKVNSKIELRFNVLSSALLTEDEKGVIMAKLTNQINKLGELLFVSQTDRSQIKNKEKVIEKFYRILEKALTPRKKRLKTKPTIASVERRLETKRVQAKLKIDRRDIGL